MVWIAASSRLSISGPAKGLVLGPQRRLVAGRRPEVNYGPGVPPPGSSKRFVVLRQIGCSLPVRIAHRRESARHDTTTLSRSNSPGRTLAVGHIPIDDGIALRRTNQMLETILGSIIIELITAAIAWLLVLGHQAISIQQTIVLGVAGSSVGGFFGRFLLSRHGRSGQPSGWIGSVIVLRVYVRVASRRAPREAAAFRFR
jgi:uncharacterized membrane protein YeaQ/YmgE (transglycosylase-associated protein family)